jgi:hypothetical protein
MRTFAIAFIGGIVGTVFTSALVTAWTGPTSAPPNANVSAPINVGSTNQVKNGGLALNSLAVFGNSAFAGNVTASGFFHSSDRTLKENIETIDGAGIVSRLRGVTFTWKKDGKPRAGVVAQEVEGVFPSAVRTSSDGVKAVEYDQIIAALIEAVKAQQAQIDALEGDNTAR